MPIDIEKILSLLYDVRNEYTSTIDVEQDNGASVQLHQCMNCFCTSDELQHDEGCIFQKIEEVIHELEEPLEDFI